MTVSIVLRLEPDQLSNPDLDIRYRLSEAIERHTEGRIRSDGYDYDDGIGPAMLLFLLANSEGDIAGVLEVLNSQRILDNDLSGIGVAIEENGLCRYAYPARLAGSSFVLRAARPSQRPLR